MDFHPVAEAFPLMSAPEFERLCHDIELNGLHEPIWVFQDKIIDGRNRFNACRELGREPRFREYAGEESNLITFVVSLNLHRRHLSESQRAMVAAKLANMRRGSQETNASKEALVSQMQAAEMLNVSRPSVQRAEKVLRKGIPELAEAVECGETTVAEASRVAALPARKQKHLIRKGRRSGQKILSNLKIKSLKKNLENDSCCLLCNPNAEATKETVSAFMQLLAARHPKFAVYFQSVTDELEELDLTGEASDAREKVCAAIGLGYQTFAQIQAKTRLETDLLNYCISVLLDYNKIYTIQQGGKTDGARGARKVLYLLVEDGAHPVKKNESAPIAAAAACSVNEDFSETDDAILAALDRGRRTLAQIRRFCSLPDIADRLEDMTSRRLIRSVSKGSITAYFRLNQKPRRFWLSGNDTVEAEYDEPAAEYSAPAVEERFEYAC